MTAELERLEALFTDPHYDGPELPADEQPEPGSGSVWAIWAGGPIKSGADLSAARCDRWWREHPQRLTEPAAGDCGGGYGCQPPTRTVHTVRPLGGVL